MFGFGWRTEFHNEIDDKEYELYVDPINNCFVSLTIIFDVQFNSVGDNQSKLNELK